MTPKQELISVTLEVFAFFFVTTELYGKQNLESLSKHAAAIADGVQAKIAKRIGDSLLSEKPPFLNRTYSEILGGARGFRFTVFLIYLPFFVTPYVWGWIHMINSGFTPELTMILIGTSVPVGFAAFLVLVYLFSGIASGAEQLLKIIGFKGLLLGIGTGLFLVSKAVPWVTAFHELIGE